MDIQGHGSGDNEHVSGTETGRRRDALLRVAAAVFLLAALRLSAPVLIPILISLVVTIVAAPFQQRLIHRGWSRISAYLTVLAVTVTAVAAGFWAVNLSLSAFLADLPAYRPGAVTLVNDTLSLGRRMGLDLRHFVNAGRLVTSTFTQADLLTRGFLASIASWAVVLLLTGFMLFEALEFPRKLRQLVPDPVRYQELSDFAAGLSRFMWILTIGAALTAAGDLVILLALGTPSALLWAALAFLLSYVPNVGAVIIVAPPTIATLVRSGFGHAILLLVLMSLVDNLVSLLLMPRLIGKHLAISPFWSVLSLVFWGWLLGPVGAILAVPLTMTAKFLLESRPETASIARLMEPLTDSPRSPRSC